MNHQAIIDILRDQEKGQVFAAGYLAALNISGIAAPFSIETEPYTAQAWVTSQVLAYFQTLEEQQRQDIALIISKFGAKPAWLAQTELIFDGSRLDNEGKPVAADQDNARFKVTKVTNQNPVLAQIMEVFQLGDAVLRKLHNDELRKLAQNLLAAHNSLSNTPFWNDIDGYVGPDGKELDTLSASPSQEQDVATVVLKRNYLSLVVIPECLRLVANYVGQKVCDTADVSDATRLQRLLGALPE